MDRKKSQFIDQEMEKRLILAKKKNTGRTLSLHEQLKTDPGQIHIFII